MAELTKADVKKLKVKELREELSKRNLDTKGLKAVLAAHALARVDEPRLIVPVDGEPQTLLLFPNQGDLLVARLAACLGARVLEICANLLGAVLDGHVVSRAKAHRRREAAPTTENPAERERGSDQIIGVFGGCGEARRTKPPTCFRRDHPAASRR